MIKYFAALLFFSFNIWAQTGRVTGTVTENSEPVPSVNIYLQSTKYGTASREDGSYELNRIPAGEYKIKFSSVGYETQVYDLNILSGKTLELNVEMNSVPIEVQQVEVTGFKNQNQNDTRTSLIDLNPKSAKILPGAGEDVLRTLQALPGVVAPNDFSSQLIVRGSGPDQNLIIMDDVEVFNPYRLYGVISMFNPEAVSDINLITGGFPAKYGDRLSAVLDVTNREGDKKKSLKGIINASIVDANLVLEGKNPGGITGSWLVNSRRTYYDLIVEPFVKNAGLVDDNVTFPNFYDVQAKLVLGPFSGHKILLNGIYSRDGVDVVSPENRKTADSVGVFNVTKNDIASMAWHYSPNSRVLNKLIFSWYRNGGATDFESKILDPSLNRDDFEDVIPDTLSGYLLNVKFDADFTFRKYSIDDKFTYVWGENIFEAGAGADLMRTIVDFRFDLDPELLAFFAANPQFRAVLSDIKNVKDYNRYRTYIQNNFKIGERLFFNPSLRFDYYDILNKMYFAPRISLSYALDEITTLRAVWGKYFQSPGYEKFLDQSVLFDFSERYTNELQAENAYHYVLGIERWLTNEWNARIEAYYKDFNDLIIQKKVTGSNYFTERIPGTDPRYIAGWTRPIAVKGDSLTQIPVNNSNGEAYGLEFFLSKKNITGNNKLSGWISYSLAFAERHERELKIPFRFDQRHTVNIVLNYELNNWLHLGMRWQYGSGFPITQPVGVEPRIILEDNNGDAVPETPYFATRRNSSNQGQQREIIYDIDYGDKRLNARKPPYHRLDIRITAFTDFWGMNWSFYLDVINVYNRKNIIGYDYFVTPELTLGRRASTMFPIIPTLGFSTRF